MNGLDRFTGWRRCAVCDVVVGCVVLGQYQARKNDGGTVKGQPVCTNHNKGKK